MLSYCRLLSFTGLFLSTIYSSTELAIQTFYTYMYCLFSTGSHRELAPQPALTCALPSKNLCTSAKIKLVESHYLKDACLQLPFISNLGLVPMRGLVSVYDCNLNFTLDILNPRCILNHFAGSQDMGWRKGTTALPPFFSHFLAFL